MTRQDNSQLAEKSNIQTKDTGANVSCNELAKMITDLRAEFQAFKDRSERPRTITMEEMQVNQAVDKGTIELTDSVCDPKDQTGNQAFLDVTKSLNVISSNSSVVQQPSFSRGDLVSPAIKEKIFADKFIDFGSLLSKQMSNDENPEITIARDATGAVILKEKEKTFKINSFDQWSKAFTIFVAVYTSKSPDCAPALMEYWGNVKELATVGGNWLLYDERFRKLKAEHRQMSWKTIHTEIWTQCTSIARTNFTKKDSFSRPFRNKGIPKGFCFPFHRGRDCPAPSHEKCHFSHQCPLCNKGKHPSSKCRSTRTSQSSPASGSAQQ